MRLGVDAMGGDYAPEAVVLGAIEASEKVLPDTTLVLFGDKGRIEQLLKENNASAKNIEIVHASQVIEMSDHPTQAFSQKTDSSIVVGFTHLKMGKIDGFASAGSTGAMMVGCMHVIKQIEGVIRPTIASALPTLKNNKALLLDVGLNVDCKPEVLYQYGLIGSIYSNVVLGNSNSRVALLNIGEEKEKGNHLTKATYQLMEGTTDFNFIGNAEPKHLFTGEVADVFVCDGFVGNTILKQTEGLYSVICASSSHVDNPFVKELNYENEGGTPVLGVNECVIIGHGCSTSKAITNMILQTEKTVKTRLVQKIKEAFC